MNRLFRPLAFTIASVIFLGITLGAGLTETLEKDATSLIYYYLAMAGSGIGVWAFFPDGLSQKRAVMLILGISVIARLLMAGFPTSDDVNRYLWEGKLLLEGESPYATVADDPTLEKFRDTYWEGMNHKDKKTAYPPLALAVFAGLNLISYHPWIYKFFFGLMDLATLGVLMRILLRRRLPIRNSLIYALSPLTILTFSGEAHFDSLFIFLTLSSLYLYEQGKLSWAWLILGLSIQIKIMSVLIIPLLFWKYRSSKSLWLLVTGALPCLFFFKDLPALAHGILHFGGNMSHNGSLNHLFIDLLGSRDSASKLSLLLLTIVVLVVSLRTKDVVKGSFFIFGALVLLSPTVHYWYLSWVLPFVVLFPSLPWLVLFALSGFYFSAWAHFGETGEWYQPMVYQRIQWIPFYFLWIPSFLQGVRKVAQNRRIQKINTISVVIPTLNESTQLRSCLNALARSIIPAEHIFVVDGGSRDDTKSIVQEFPVNFLESERGRGCQIAVGVNASKSDVILVLHADALLPANSVSNIVEALNDNPYAVGGAIGQRFASKGPKPVLLLVEALNDFRAAWMGSSFGDQGQFFRRDAIDRAGGFPNIPLMEDVELTALLEKEGDHLLLDGNLICSARRWETDNATKRFLQVLSLVIRYRFLRLLGKDPSRKLFEEYYPS